MNTTVNNINSNCHKKGNLNMSEKLQFKKAMLHALTKELLRKQEIDIATYHKMCDKIKALKS